MSIQLPIAMLPWSREMECFKTMAQDNWQLRHQSVLRMQCNICLVFSHA